MRKPAIARSTPRHASPAYTPVENEKNGIPLNVGGRGLVEGDVSPFLRDAATVIAEKLDVVSLGVFFKEQESFTLIHTTGSRPGRTITLPRSAPLIGNLAASVRPMMVESQFGEEGSLAGLRPSILVPIHVNGELLAFFSVGAKINGDAYSSQDLSMLDLVSSHLSQLMTNGRLMEALRPRIAEQERLHRELEIAREVHFSFYPRHFPPVPGLDYFGAYRPAYEIGGDYFDFLALSANRLGFAIGDVAGKGIAAALMMGNLQASLRARVIPGEDDVRRVVGDVNRLIYCTSPSNLYATFFYAQYDPDTQLLTYVNAGHDAPYLIRGDGSGINRLEVGGTVLGLRPDSPYKQASVPLRSGDVVVAFTDGLSEAVNAEGELWTESRLLDVAQAAMTLPADEIVTRVMESVEQFSSGLAQQDDRALVVVRVVPLREEVLLRRSCSRRLSAVACA